MQRTLIVYFSKYGSTQEVAELMAKILGPAMCITPDNFDEKYYDVNLVLIVSPIYYEKLDQKIQDFIIQNKDWLKGRMVALLVLAMSEALGIEIIKPFEEMLGDSVIWSGVTLGRITINKLDEYDKNELEKFYRITGTPFEDNDGISIEKIVNFSLKIKDEREKRIDAPSSADLRESIKNFMKEHNTCVLATGFKTNIRSTPIEYTYNDGNIYIISEGGEKFANIALNKKVSISIFNQYTGMNNLMGLVLTGNAQIIDRDSEAYQKVIEEKNISYQKIMELPFYLNILKIELEKAEFLSSNFILEGYNSKQIYYFKKN